MKPKELLCIALIAENGKRYDAEVYTDGTFKNQEGEYEKLTPLQFENIKVLQRRADREKMLIVAANDVVPYREGDKEPEPYTENIAPLTEEDFLLLEERQLPADMVVADKIVPDLPAIPLKKEKSDPHKEADAKKATPDEPKSDKKNEAAEKTEAGAEKETEPDSKETTEKIPSKPKKKKRVPIVLIIVLLLMLLCGAGFGIGYMNGYFDLNMLPGIVMDGLEQVTGKNETVSNQPTVTPAPTPTQEQEPAPTPTPLPPKTEINLTINAMDGAEVSGSTDVGVNEENQTDAEQNPSETTSPDRTDTN